MSTPVNSELKRKHGVNAVPIRVGDEVRILRGEFNGRGGKVIALYSKKWVIHIEHITTETVSGKTANVGLDPSNCLVTKLKNDNRRKSLLGHTRSWLDNQTRAQCT